MKSLFYCGLFLLSLSSLSTAAENPYKLSNDSLDQILNNKLVQKQNGNVTDEKRFYHSERWAFIPAIDVEKFVDKAQDYADYPKFPWGENLHIKKVLFPKAEEKWTFGLDMALNYGIWWPIKMQAYHTIKAIGNKMNLLLELANHQDKIESLKVRTEVIEYNKGVAIQEVIDLAVIRTLIDTSDALESQLKVFLNRYLRALRFSIDSKEFEPES